MANLQKPIYFANRCLKLQRKVGTEVAYPLSLINKMLSYQPSLIITVTMVV